MFRSMKYGVAMAGAIAAAAPAFAEQAHAADSASDAGHMEHAETGISAEAVQEFNAMLERHDPQGVLPSVDAQSPNIQMELAMRSIQLALGFSQKADKFIDQFESGNADQGTIDAATQLVQDMQHLPEIVHDVPGARMVAEGYADLLSSLETALGQ